VLQGVNSLLVVDGGEGDVSVVVAVLGWLPGHQLLPARLQGVALGGSVVQHLPVPVGVARPEPVFVSKSNVVSSCDGAVESTEPVVAAISMGAMSSIAMQINISLDNRGTISIGSLGITVDNLAMAGMISIYYRRSMAMVGINSRSTKYNLGNLGRDMAMVGIYSRCIGEDLGRSIVGAMIILDNDARSMQGGNFLHVQDVVKLAMTVVINLLMDLVKLIVEGIVTSGKIFNVIVVIIQVTVLGGLRPGITGHNKQQLEHCSCC